MISKTPLTNLRGLCARIGDDGPRLSALIDKVEAAAKDEEERVNDLLHTIGTHHGKRAVIAARLCVDNALEVGSVLAMLVPTELPHEVMNAIAESFARIIKNTVSSSAALVTTSDIQVAPNGNPGESIAKMLSTLATSKELVRIISPAVDAVLEGAKASSAASVQIAEVIERRQDEFFKFVDKK